MSTQLGIARVHPARPLAGWRQISALLWIQNRGAVLALLTLMSLLAALTLGIGLDVHQHYAAYASCNFCASGSNFFDQKPWGLWPPAFAIVLRVVPMAVGVFVGAPLVAAEVEAGTNRFLWTQTIGRTRWLVGKLLVLGIPYAIAAGLIAWLFQWSFGPYVTLGLQDPWNAMYMDVSPFALAGWSVLALGLGAFIGSLAKRTVASMSLVSLCVVALIALSWWNAQEAMLSLGSEHAVAAPITDPTFGGRGVSPAGFAIRQAAPTEGGALSQAFLLSGRLVNDGGKPMTDQEQLYLNEHLPSAAPMTDKDGEAVTSQTAVRQLAWLASRGDEFIVQYQPADRRWLFGFLEGVVLFGASAASGAGAVRASRKLI